jgi:cytochrome P450 family 6
MASHNKYGILDTTRCPFSEIDGDDFVAQAFAFLAAGFETSATTMSFALYELALHPHIQRRLRMEITQVLHKHNGELTYDGMQKMSYLDMVVSGKALE